MKSKMIRPLVVSVCVEMILLMGVSCEKMKVEPENSGSEHPNVVVRVATIEQMPFAVATRSGVLAEVCTRLNFLLYDANGSRIGQVSQTIEDENFGEARFIVPQGHYYLTVLAHSSDGNPTSTNLQRIGFTNKTGYTDTFFCGETIDVGEADLERTLELKRIVAMVRFIPYDNIPAHVQRIGFYYTGGSGTLDATNDGWGGVNSKQLQYYDINHDEEKFEIYTIPHEADDDRLDVTISTYEPDTDGSDVLKTERKVEGIPVRRNHITTCRGYIFSPVYKLDIKITIDDEWSTDLLEFNFY